MRPVLLVTLLLAAATSAAEIANPAIGPLFPDCPGCAEPGPQPLQVSTLEAPAGYLPGERYEMALYVIPHHGLVSRFVLGVDKGVLSSADENVKVVNSSFITYSRAFSGGRPVWKFAWTAPPAGSGNATFTFTTMSGFGDGVMGRDAWWTRRVAVPEGAPAAPGPTPGFEAAAALAVLVAVGLWAVQSKRR
ncbi:MAG: choice-of-anchor V domain-containing protein [Halobacteria archaeon]